VVVIGAVVTVVGGTVVGGTVVGGMVVEVGVVVVGMGVVGVGTVAMVKVMISESTPSPYNEVNSPVLSHRAWAFHSPLPTLEVSETEKPGVSLT
jgi:hypothetical protein